MWGRIHSPWATKVAPTIALAKTSVESRQGLCLLGIVRVTDDQARLSPCLFSVDFLNGLGYKKSSLPFSVIPNQSEETKSMNISLTPHFEELVKGKVESGLYNSASEVMREALRLLEERDQLRKLRLDELKSDIQKGIDSGEGTPLDTEEIMARGRKRLDAQQMKG